MYFLSDQLGLPPEEVREISLEDAWGLSRYYQKKLGNKHGPR